MNIADMEWLYHVDLDMAPHRTKEEIARTARLAFDILKNNQKLQLGDILVIAVVRPPKVL